MTTKLPKEKWKNDPLPMMKIWNVIFPTEEPQEKEKPNLTNPPEKTK